MILLLESWFEISMELFELVECSVISYNILIGENVFGGWFDLILG